MNRSRSPRALAIILAATFAVGTASFVRPTLAQDAPPAAPAENKELRDAVETYWHYGKTAQYKLAAEWAGKIKALNADPAQVMATFEAVAAARKDNVEQWLLRWQGVEEMRESTTELINIISGAHRAQRTNPAFIKATIERLSQGDRARMVAMERLRESGELAVPSLLDVLKDPARRNQHSLARVALRELGRSALNPLVAATESKDSELLTQVIASLGELGYDAAVPYLARLAQDKEATESVRRAATNALSTMGAAQASKDNVADQFYALGEKFYYEKASIVPDKREPMAAVWFYDETNGLMKKDVQPAIFNEIMAMRSCEYALGLGDGKSDALSLWLAANYKRESQLTEGQTDATRAENQPAAHFYGVAAGTQYLNAVLTRAEKDRDAAVALRAVKSLQEIAGQANIIGSDQAGPLLDGMRFPDRQVRYESAFAIAGGLPQKQFAGQEQVVPLLAEAINQTGGSNVLLLVANQDALNTQTELLKGAGFSAVGSTSAEGAIAASAQKPTIDVVIISEDVEAGQIERLLSMLSSTPKLERVPRLVTTKNIASPWTMAAARDPLMVSTQATDGPGLKLAIEEARKKTGLVPLDEATSTKYALRAAELLSKLAISRGQVLDLSVAEGTILGALEDARPEVAKAAGNVVALYPTKNAQSTLLTKALDEKTADELKTSLFKSVALSAKFNGNLVEQSLTDSLVKAVDEGKNVDVRSAAAEALGALNLPTDQAKKLIVSQSKK